MSSQGQQYFTYLLRAWREREDSHWRFSLEGVNEKEQVYFASFRNLVVYLAALIHNPRRSFRHTKMEFQETSDQVTPEAPETSKPIQ
jgi:hypothetical protein